MNNRVRKSQNFELYLKTWDILDFCGIALFHVSTDSSLRGLVLNERVPSIYLTPLFCKKKCDNTFLLFNFASLLLYFYTIYMFRIIKDLKDDLGCKFARSYNHFISYVDCIDYFPSKENF